MEFKEFIASLKEELSKELPGRDFQLKMSSLKRIRELLNNEPDLENAVKSSVLLLLYPGHQINEIKTVLIQRPLYEGVHGGQISLPGGKYEETDEGLAETALRESKEEIGIDPEAVILIGSLTDLYIPPSNYLVHPFVGYMLLRPDFTADPAEVDKIIEFDVRGLLDESNIKCKDIYVRPGITVYGPSYEIDGNTIWGATAMILSEFREILQRMFRSLTGSLQK